MEIRLLNKNDAKQFSNLILAMYQKLDNFEWFGLMPTDIENITAMIESPRFTIMGAFENGVLVGVSSFDYLCGKLIGKIDFPADCDTEHMVEVAFTLVNPNYRGKHIAGAIIEKLMKLAVDKKYQSIFAKIHVDNIPSQKVFMRLGYKADLKFVKEVHREKFEKLLTEEFLNDTARKNAIETLAKSSGELPLSYQIFY